MYTIYRENEPIMTMNNWAVAVDFCAESTMSTGIHYWVKENI